MTGRLRKGEAGVFRGTGNVYSLVSCKPVRKLSMCYLSAFMKTVMAAKAYLVLSEKVYD